MDPSDVKLDELCQLMHRTGMGDTTIPCGMRNTRDVVDVTAVEDGRMFTLLSCAERASVLRSDGVEAMSVPGCKYAAMYSADRLLGAFDGPHTRVVDVNRGGDIVREYGDATQRVSFKAQDVGFGLKDDGGAVRFDLREGGERGTPVTTADGEAVAGIRAACVLPGASPRLAVVQPWKQGQYGRLFFLEADGSAVGFSRSIDMHRQTLIAVTTCPAGRFAVLLYPTRLQVIDTRNGAVREYLSLDLTSSSSGERPVSLSVELCSGGMVVLILMADDTVRKVTLPTGLDNPEEIMELTNSTICDNVRAACVGAAFGEGFAKVPVVCSETGNVRTLSHPRG